MAMFPLGVTVELLLNNAWTDITGHVYLRDDITISGGAQQEGDTAQPAQMTLTVDNRDGRFTPNYTGSPYYPYLTRGVQIRLLLKATSSSGNLYWGYRFWGTVTEWPPLNDISGRDVYVQVTANGPLRQLAQGGGKGSALARYFQTLTGPYAPVAYWPCEEDPETNVISPGVFGGLTMAITGTPAWKAISDFNGSLPIGVLNGSTWDGLTGSFNSSGDDIYNSPGTYTWVAGTTTVDARVWAPGGGGGNGTFGFAGGGGEFARESALAVTPGKAYTFTIQPGGRGGGLSNNNTSQSGADGATQTFAGDSVTVTAHGGKGGTNSATGAGGTGSANTAHFNGGAGGGRPFGAQAGGGGGSSAGTAAAGNAGSDCSGSTGGAGGSAPSGGGAGGRGGDSPTDAGVATGHSPGGGGGAGAHDPNVNSAHSGQAGAAAKVELIYTPQTTPTYNVVRFVLLVPVHGGNPGKVLVRAFTGGTIHQLDVLYVAGGKIQLKGYNSSGTLLFTSSSLTIGDGQTVMVSAELAPSGTAVAYTLKAIIPGATAVLGTVTGTQATASLGNVTEILAGPNGDITKTAIGHISLQYALIDLLKVSRALNGHVTEMGVDRFIRLCNEAAVNAYPQYKETDDHWGFELASQVSSWTATNATISQSTTALSGTPWSFAASGTPLDQTYFIATTTQAALINVGDKFNDVLNAGKTFTVTFIGAPFAGFQNISFTPPAATIMDSTDTVTEIIGAGWPADGSHSLLMTAAGGAGQWVAKAPNGTSGHPVQPGDVVSVHADVYAPAALSHVIVSVDWFNSAGTYLSTTSASPIALASGGVDTVKVTGTAPATAAFFGETVACTDTVAAGTLLYADNVRVHPRMGQQTARAWRALLREIEDLDQGILKEVRTDFAIGYRTRLSLVNQSPAVTLDYSQGTLSPPLTPVVDDKLTRNVITVRRRKGSSVTVSLSSGAMSVQAPPNGVFPMKTLQTYALEKDEQLVALAAHLLNLGTVTDERYPTVTVNLARASLPGNALAPLMSAVAGVEPGDLIQITNLPFWYPSTSTTQLVIGYTETISAWPKSGGGGWQITWNCVPGSPWTITSTLLRRW